MRKLRYLPIVLLLLPLSGAAQAPDRLLQENGDCTGAIPISGTEYRQPHSVRGFGNKLEIKENPKEDLKWFEREHHTTWYKFRAPHTTTLTFDIIPEDPADDYDFLVFEGAIPGICDKIASRQVVPIRSNIARNDVGLGSMCGLSKDATDDYVRSGVGASYSRAMEVQEGDLFYLVVDNPNRPLGGYTIRFHYDPPAPPPPTAEERKERQKVFIDILDARTGEPLEAALTIEGMEFDQVVEAKGSSSYTYEMEAYRNLRLACVRSGYMFQTMRVKGSLNPEVRIQMKLQPIAPGEHVVLEDIRFVGNEDKILRSSEAALLLLLRFMQENPDLRIEIEGHVNGPTFKNKKEFVELSTSRARSIYDFLMVNDIEPQRVNYVGLGNSRMLYPDPKNKEQSEANRRVEIKVVSN